ncbi:MAG: DNA polymerase III subunit delta [Deltaproteobacteria bacterium]|nr:DNA polymerase III subunit delta [Deltaproteobacteria bacterium]
MTPEDAIGEIESGKPRPVYVVVGEERIFADRVVAAARKHVVEPAMAGFNVDVFEAGEAHIGRVIDSANTMPMMARRRLIVLRGLERLDKGDDDGKSKGSPTDALAEYVASPSPSTCLILVGSKLDGRRKLSSVAKKANIVVDCAPLRPHELPRFVRDEAKRRGNPIAEGVADALVDLVGGELAGLIDAVERLSLFVGDRQPITEEAVHACIARVRVGSVWGLTDAVAARDRATALRLLNENFDARDRGLPLHGLLASSVRKMLKMRALLEAGLSADDAAKGAGIPPFKSRDTAAQLRRFRPGELERAVSILAEADLGLKGSKRPPLLVLEEAILRLTS